MTIIGGFIQRVGLVKLAGDSSLEWDCESTYFNPFDNHTSNKPQHSTGWYWTPYGRDSTTASDTNNTSRLCAPVDGMLKEWGAYVITNTATSDVDINFRVNGSGTEILAIPSLTTGYVNNDAVDITFSKFDRINFNSVFTGGNFGCQTTSIIEWY